MSRLTLRIVGFDLSLTGTGAAQIDHSGETVSISVETYKSVGHNADTLQDRHRRLDRLSARFIGIGETADLVCVETAAYSKAVGHATDRAGLWWLTVDGLLRSGVHVVEVGSGQRAKYACGKGNGSKEAVLLAMARRFPNVNICNNNEADALALAAMGARHLGLIVDDMPALNRSAMDGVRWL